MAFLAQCKTTEAAQLARFAGILRAPDASRGYFASTQETTLTVRWLPK
jgi:hypothetical protein